MKRYPLLFATLTILLLSCVRNAYPELREGDIIFQTSRSTQSKAIQLATHSPYSHVGLILKENDHLVVLEAVQPVKETPLQDWIRRGVSNGKGNPYAVRRLKDANRILTPAVLEKMKVLGRSYLNKNYDPYFEWSDDRMYCSEIVYKIYKQAAGIEIGHLQKLKDFDLSNALVKKKMMERYKNNIPWNEWVISPAGLFDSDQLKTIQ